MFFSLTCFLFVDNESNHSVEDKNHSNNGDDDDDEIISCRSTTTNKSQNEAVKRIISFT